MSIDPTPYDLQQDSRIDDLREIVTTSYEEATGDEQSFPVVDQPMNDDQWAHLAKAFGSGVISYGGAPYRLGNVSDVDNTLTVHRADDEGRESGGIIEGFAHRMTGDVQIKVGPVLETTDYMIGLQYDPVRAKEEGHPILLDCFARPLDTTQGKKYAPIWEGTRRPSTVLSSVNWQTARSRIAPTTTVSRERFLPDPRHSGLMWGTLCYTYRDREWFQLQWATEEGGEMVWQNITAPEWENLPLVSPRQPYGGDPLQMRRVGRQVFLRGWVLRNSLQNDFTTDNNNNSGWGIVEALPSYARPKRSVRLPLSGSNSTSASGHSVSVNTSGKVTVWVAKDVGWVSLDNVSYWLD